MQENHFVGAERALSQSFLSQIANATASPSDGNDGIASAEDAEIASDRHLGDVEFMCQIWNSIRSPLNHRV